MNKQMIQLLGAGLVSSALVGCGGVDGSNAENQQQASNSGTNEITQLPNNYMLSLNGGTGALCTGLQPSNCNGYVSFAQSNIFEQIPESQIAFIEPPKFVVTQDAIDSLESNLADGQTWNADTLRDLRFILNYILENPFDEAGENVYDSLEQDADNNLRDVIADALFNGDGEYANFNNVDNVDAFVGEDGIDGYVDVWDAMTDPEYDAFVASVKVGSDVPEDTFTYSESSLVSLKASGLFSTAEKNVLDIVFAESSVQELASVSSGDFLSTINGLDISPTTFDVTISGSEVFDELMVEYPDFPGEPDPLFSYLHIGSSDRYGIEQADFDYMEGEMLADGQSQTLIDKTIAILEVVAQDIGVSLDYGTPAYADRGEAYSALKTSFENAEATVQGSTVSTFTSGLTATQVNGLQAYFKDRPATDKREVAAVNDSTDSNVVGYFNNLVRDIKRAGGNDATVAILSVNGENPYRDAEVYSSVFELEGLNTQWVPVDAATLTAQADANECANLFAYVAENAGEAALELDYPSLAEQHLAACKDSSLITAAIEGADAVFVTGGDFTQGLDALVDGTDTAWYTALKNAVDTNGLLLAGEGAGSELAAATLLDSTTGTAALGGDAITTSTGAGVFDFGLVDTFTADADALGEGDAIARLAVALNAEGERFGFAIKAGSSLRIADISSTEVEMRVGGETVFILDAENATGTEDIVLHNLSEGDVITLNPQTNELSVRFDATKSDANDGGFNSEASDFSSDNDAFNASRISSLVFDTYLAGFDENPLTIQGPRNGDGDLEATSYTMTITRNADSVVVGNGSGNQSFTGLELDIVENP